MQNNWRGCPPQFQSQFRLPLNSDAERPTAWLGIRDSNSKMSAQIIPLKSRTDLRGSSRILAAETIRV